MPAPLIPGLTSPANALTGMAGGGLPLQYILPIVYSFLSSQGLFGGGDEEKERWLEMREMEDMMRRFGLGRFSRQEKLASQLSPAVLKALVAQLQRTSGWGYPEGMGLDLSFLDKFLTGGFGSPLIRRASGAPSVIGGTTRTVSPGRLRRG